MGDSELFPFVSRSWQDKKHLSLYLYQAYTVLWILWQHPKSLWNAKFKDTRKNIELSYTEIKILVSALK